ncbi:TonB-dependent receptor [Chitinophaga horti]|uniref:TonB-dependent receptor n=1 Tax=Chitinophaga horti TaxID=2920382 RepID=A0ABY6J832_9BACT|nr:TonB-dependent receptor [Chitinophaga horti]UYQ95853.1 TonB-dependent receptor [Chitinophaga horti]
MYRISTRELGIPVPIRPHFAKFFLMMRLITFIMLATLMQVSARSIAQKVSLNANNASLKAVLKDIGKQCGYNFVITESSLRESRPVNIQVTNVDLADALDRIFSTQVLTYSINKTTIVVKEKEFSLPLGFPIVTPAVIDEVRGRVTDDNSTPLPGVSVKIKGTAIGTQTNDRGEFSIHADRGVTLVLSYIGFESKEVIVAGNNLNITLVSKQSAIDMVVVNGYTSQRRSDVTAAISTVSGKDILRAPVTNVNNALAGLVPGLVVQQTSGRPGINSAALYIRGQVSSNATALIIVDGVERTTFGDIDPNEIESINILKDASSTALYGLKGANGVFVITTKKGKEGPARVTFTNNIAIVSPTRRPDILGAYESAMLLTEGQINVGEPRTFTDEDLQIFKDGTGEKLLYPDVNWYEELVKDQWSQNQQNLTISGGTQSIKYFTSFGHQFENGHFKEFKTPLDYSTTPSYQRYNFRARVSMDVTKTTNFEVNLAGRNEHRYSPAGFTEHNDPAGAVSNGIEGVVGRALKMPSWGSPFFKEYINSDDPAIIGLDGTYNHIVNYNLTGVNSVNPYALLTYGGYAFTDNNVAESVFTLNQKLDFLTKGLSVKAQFGYDATQMSGKLQRGSIGYYNLDRSTKQLSLLAGSYNDFFGAPAYTRSGFTKTNLQVFINYTRTFDKHNVSANLIGQRELQGATSAAAPFANQGVISQLTYNYANRYFMTASATYNGSENYASGYRYGFFPSASLGYNLANEHFMKRYDWINMLKVRGSVGRVGIPSPGTGRFYYQNRFGAGSNVPFGNPNSNFSAPTYIQTQYGNPFVTFEVSLKKNLGLDVSLFRDRLNIQADIFDDTRSNILTTRSGTSFATYGATVPSTNYARNYNRGYELSVTYRSEVKDFVYSVTGNLSYAHNERQIMDEAPGLAANLKATGTSLGTYFGYHVLGFYADQGDIDKSPVNKVTAYPSIPGDFKYQDINGDGIINNQDVMPIGHPNIPEYNASMNFQFGYKGFQLSLLFNGVTNVSSNVIFQSNSLAQYYAPMLGRWTPDNPNPTWPATRPGLNANPNESLNDFILQDASYIKLRNVQLTYSLPRRWISRLRLQNLTLVASGQNLITWTKFYGLDPENTMSGNAYAPATTTIPTTKVINFGLNVSL